MFKRLRRLFIYIRIIKKNRELLKQKHDLNIDWVWRLYTTYTIPELEIDTIKDYGTKYLDQLIQKEVHKIDETFMKIQLSELVGFMEAVDLSNRDVGLAFRFKYIDTAKTLKNIIWFILLIIGAGLGFLIGSYVGMLIGIISWLIVLIIGKAIS
jgi:hypothetical protein